MHSERSDDVDERGRRLASRVFAVLSLLAVLFILGVSFIPDSGRLEVLAPEQRTFFRVPNFSRLFVEHDLRDITTNVLLYVPLGVFVALSASGRRVRWVSFGLLAGPVLSVLVEATQGLTNRISDVVDVITNSTGHVCGYLLVAIAVNVFGLRPGLLIGIAPRAVGSASLEVRASTLSAVRFLYLGVYFVVALLPFHISVSIGLIYDQLVEGADGQVRIVLDPLHHLATWPEGSLELLLVFLGLIPIAVLTTLIDSFRGRATLVRPVLHAVLAAVVAEGLKLFNLSRTSDVIAPILAVAAGVVGVIAGRLWVGIQRTDAGGPAASAADRGRRRSTVLLVAIGYGFLLSLLAWYPYQFESHAAAVAHKLKHESNLYPFRMHIGRRDLGSALDIVEEVGLFVPLGLLCALYLRSGERRLPAWMAFGIAAVVCGTAGGLLELSQAVCIGRYVDVTDALLAAAGGVVGVGLMTLVSPSPQR